MENKNTRLLTTQEIAEYINISHRTVESWVSKRKIPFVKVGRLTRFRIDQIEEWIENKKIKPQG